MYQNQCSTCKEIFLHESKRAVTCPKCAALHMIHQYGGIDGNHHKQWVLDQVVRALTGAKYDDWVKEHNDGKDGPDTYEWDVGIAP